ncbi:hypothetical protein QBC39DRAFT_375896 [Podospora conica]|nr:hypothetical protein QBC39DRAFT_375896 [Schizothecium conicum]
MSSPRSPKRRKILSSINPPEDRTDQDDHRSRAHRPRHRRRSPSRPPPPRRNTPDRDPPATTHSQDEATATTTTSSHDKEDAPRVTKFRFKSSHRHSSHRSSHRSSRRRSRSRSRHRDSSPTSTTRRHHHRSSDPSDPSRPRRHHHHRRRHRSPSPPPQPTSPHPQQPHPQDDPFSAPLDRDTAFRESLFDALADDEGAAYWESVYGQPIHIYTPSTGPLERMTDEEYASHVRQKMWEKTHAGLLEERARRTQQRAADAERARLAAEMERSLRRGDERRRRRAGWEGYAAKWGAWDGGVEGIPWPVPVPVPPGDGGKERDEAVRAFFVRGLGLEEVGEKEFAARLKEERVRWHPDKMQQRLGGTVDEGVMREVTATFQVIERLWNDTRGK